jgi:uncharacterized protein (DUF3084 family)
MNTLKIVPAKIDTDEGTTRTRNAGRTGVRAKRHAHRRRLSRNDVVFRTASGVTLIAAGPSDRSQRWFRNPIPRRSPAA